MPTRGGKAETIVDRAVAKALQFDPCSEHLLLGTGFGIQRRDLDGTYIDTIARGRSVKKMAIDQRRGYVYTIADAKNGKVIERCAIKPGAQRETIISGLSGMART